MADQLQAIRDRIDRLDRQVADLLARRFALAMSLRRLKLKTADPVREKIVLANAAACSDRPALSKALRGIFSEIIRQSKKLQGYRER